MMTIGRIHTGINTVNWWILNELCWHKNACENDPCRRRRKKTSWTSRQIGWIFRKVRQTFLSGWLGQDSKGFFGKGQVFKLWLEIGPSIRSSVRSIRILNFFRWEILGDSTNCQHSFSKTTYDGKRRRICWIQSRTPWRQVESFPDQYLSTQ